MESKKETARLIQLTCPGCKETTETTVKDCKLYCYCGKLFRPVKKRRTKE